MLHHMSEGEASQFSNEKLVPRKSIGVCLDVTAETPLLTEITQQVKNMQVEEVVKVSDPFNN